MSELENRQLKVHVERIIRPVQAIDDTKLKMRHELYAHLEGIYQQERQQLGDEDAALAQAKRRIGDPAELTRELQASVPAFERLYARLFGYRWSRQESWLRYAGRLALAIMILDSVLVLLVTQTIVQISGGSSRSGIVLSEILAVLAVANLVIPAGVYLATGMWTSWHGVFHVRRSRRRAFAYGTVMALGSWVAGPALGIWLTEGFSTRMAGPLAIMLVLAAALPVLIALATSRLARRLRRCQEWERLEIRD